MKPAPDARTGSSEFVVFLAGGQMFAAPSLDLVRVLQLAPDWREAPLPVAVPEQLTDLAEALGLQSETPAATVLVLKAGDRSWGLLVQQVRDVSSIAHDALRRLPAWFSSLGTHACVWGAAELPASAPLLLLDLFQLRPAAAAAVTTDEEKSESI